VEKGVKGLGGRGERKVRWNYRGSWHRTLVGGWSKESDESDSTAKDLGALPFKNRLTKNRLITARERRKRRYAGVSIGRG